LRYYIRKKRNFMKKLAIMGSGNGSNFEAIARYLQGRNDIEITCLCNVKDAYIFERAEILGIKSQHVPFNESFEYFSQNKFDLIVLAGYMRILPENVLKIMGDVINIHPALLPSFKGKDAIKDAFEFGAKVSGVTIHYVVPEVDSGKIIAQYPVFIDNSMHFDEFEAQIHNIEHKLYPIVVEKVLDDKVFDFSDLMKSGCSSGSGCGGGCHKK
jgi:phosphoribosylglycinamide formyltransferase-1